MVVVIIDSTSALQGQSRETIYLRAPMENPVSNDFISTFVDSITVFDCSLPGVMLAIFVLPAIHGRHTGIT